MNKCASNGADPIMDTHKVTVGGRGGGGIGFIEKTTETEDGRKEGGELHSRALIF